jgi:hypothetical protein
MFADFLAHRAVWVSKLASTNEWAVKCIMPGVYGASILIVIDRYAATTDALESVS